MQDSSILEVLNLDSSIQSASSSKGDSITGNNLNFLVDVKISSIELDSELLSAVKSETVGVLAGLELERENSHTHKIAPMDSLEALGNHGLDSLEVGSPRC